MGVDRAAVNRHVAAVAAVIAADTRAAVRAALGCHVAAVNRHVAGRSIVVVSVAANARAADFIAILVLVATARGVDVAAVNGDASAAANARLPHAIHSAACGVERPGALNRAVVLVAVLIVRRKERGERRRKPRKAAPGHQGSKTRGVRQFAVVDIERTARRNIDSAGRVQFATVQQNQPDLSANGNASLNCDGFFRHIDALAPCRGHVRFDKRVFAYRMRRIFSRFGVVGSIRHRVKDHIRDDFLSIDFRVIAGEIRRRQSRVFSINGEIFLKRDRSNVRRGGNAVVVLVRPAKGAAADSRAVFAARRCHRAAADGNRRCRAFVAAADSRAVFAACRRDLAAADGNCGTRHEGRALGASSAAANACGVFFAVRCDHAAADVDGDGTLVAPVSAADTRAAAATAHAARRRNLAAANRNLNASIIAVAAVTDTRAAVRANRRDIAAGDSNFAAFAVRAAADSRAAIVARRRYLAAVDGNRAALARIGAANARAVISAGSDNRTAANRDRTASRSAKFLLYHISRLLIPAAFDDGFAADACAAPCNVRVSVIIAFAIAARFQLSHAVAVGLRVNRQAVVATDGNALACGQVRAVFENQPHVARDRDTVAVCQCVCAVHDVHDVPLGFTRRAPRRTVGRDKRVSACIRL